ncbi:MAG TPA: hypothetical protein VFJ16_09480 [Longimicrobium sp.]|nr:hypothetical protein [Longimicrobium sp.]
MDLKPCRDCGTPVQWTSRSCPHCGIMNPVQKWVALPDGADETYRVPVPRLAETPAPPASPMRPPGYGRAPEVPAGLHDPLADARKKIKACAWLFYFVALVNLVASYWLGEGGVVIAVIVAALATWLWTQGSQIAAGLLLLFALFNIVMLAKSGQMAGIWMAILIVLTSWRALNATMLLRDANAALAP